MEENMIFDAEELTANPNRRKELIRSFVQRTLPTHMTYSADFINNLEKCLMQYIQHISIVADDQAKILIPSRLGSKRIGPQEVIGALDNTGFHEFSSLLGKYAKKNAESQMLGADMNGGHDVQRSSQSKVNSAVPVILSSSVDDSVTKVVQEIDSNNNTIDTTVPSNTAQPTTTTSGSKPSSKDRSSSDGVKKFSTKGLPKGPYPKRQRVGI
jgi:hypothetical protein